MTPDPVIDHIREVRRRISAEFDHDPRKLVEHYQKLQKRHGDRVVNRADEEPKPTNEDAA